MLRLLQIFCLFTTGSLWANGHLSVVVSVPEQRLYVMNAEGREVTRYSISTSKFGTGSSYGSYSTPLGQLEVASKHGSGAVEGTVFKGCARTGEVCKVNARGRDPIVTRILWLKGLEKQNANAYGRRIYIHGTPDEKNIGRKASYGCVRMRSRDIIALYETIGAGTRVEITNDRVGSLFSKAYRPQAALIAAAPVVPEKAPASKKASAAAVAVTEAVAPAPSKAGKKGETTGKVADAKPATVNGEKARSLSLDEPLIGGPGSEDRAHSAKKKGVAAVTPRKNRS